MRDTVSTTKCQCETMVEAMLHAVGVSRDRYTAPTRIESRDGLEMADGRLRVDAPHHGSGYDDHVKPMHDMYGVKLYCM